MDFSEKWGNDVAIATELALKDLKVSIDEVNVIVLEEPSKGFLGIGSKLAKVRVEKKAMAKDEVKEVVVEPKIEKTVETIEKKNPERKESLREENKFKKEKKFDKESIALEKPDNLSEVTDNIGLSFIKEISEKMGIDVSAKAEANEDSLFIYIEGPGTGTIIGKRGQTLDAIQYLTSLVVNKNEKDYKRVVLDAENYREKREKTLEELAERLAAKAIKTKKSVRLEPMNPYERKVIHATLSKNDKIITRSMGEEPYRRVVITLK